MYTYAKTWWCIWQSLKDTALSLDAAIQMDTRKKGHFNFAEKISSL